MLILIFGMELFWAVIPRLIISFTFLQVQFYKIVSFAEFSRDFFFDLNPIVFRKLPLGGQLYGGTVRLPVKGERSMLDAYEDHVLIL